MVTRHLGQTADVSDRKRAIGGLVVTLVLCLAAAAWFAGSWVDAPPDNTCGSLWRTDLWDDSDSCVPTMALRAGVSLLLPLLPVAAWLLTRRLRPALVGIAMGACIVVVVVVLAVNELVRSGGAWAS